MDLCNRIIELRQYARAKRLVEHAKEEGDAPDWAVELVFPVIEAKMTARLEGD